MTVLKSQATVMGGEGRSAAPLFKGLSQLALLTFYPLMEWWGGRIPSPVYPAAPNHLLCAVLT